MEDELRQQVAATLAYTKQVHEDLVKIKKYILWQQIFNVVKIVIIIVPLLLGFIYAFPVIKEAISAYKEVMTSLGGVSAGSVSGGLFQGLLK